MNRERFKQLFPSASPDTIALNCSVGAVPDTERQHHQGSEGFDSRMASGKDGVGYRITIISVRRKLCDAHDNLRTGAKALVDRITETLGFKSDDDPLLTWEYQQFKTEGQQGTIVKIEAI